MDDRSDRDRFLIERFVRDRDEGSFRELYGRHADHLYRFCLSMAGNEDVAYDVVQEAWLRVARSIERFRGSSTFRTWLFGIAVNCCRELRRGHAREDASPIPDPGSSASTRFEERMDLIRAVSSLPERSREVLVLHEILGHTHAEIGEMLAIDAGTSKSQLSYARMLMRDWFAKRELRREEMGHAE